MHVRRVRGLQLGRERRRLAALGVAPDDRLRVGRGARAVEAGGGTDAVEHVAPLGLADEVGVVTRCPQALVVGEDDGEALVDGPLDDRQVRGRAVGDARRDRALIAHAGRAVGPGQDGPRARGGRGGRDDGGGDGDRLVLGRPGPVEDLPRLGTVDGDRHRPGPDDLAGRAGRRITGIEEGVTGVAGEGRCGRRRSGRGCGGGRGCGCCRHPACRAATRRGAGVVGGRCAGLRGWDQAGRPARRPVPAARGEQREGRDERTRPQPAASAMMSTMDPAAYDELSLFQENASEFGLPWPGPPSVRREDVALTGGGTLSALVWGPTSGRRSSSSSTARR